MTRPEEIAAALERWRIARQAPGTFGVPEAVVRDGDELARLLCAANPPAEAHQFFAGEPGSFSGRHGYDADGSPPAPATPAAGEDDLRDELHSMEILIGLYDGQSMDGSVLMSNLSTIRARLTALLADVARLTEELAVEQKRVEDHRENAQFWMNQAERKGATLAAVRKVAEDYHDVDQVGDPPQWKACNPCANEILNVLEGK